MSSEISTSATPTATITLKKFLLYPSVIQLSHFIAHTERQKQGGTKETLSAIETKGSFSI